MAAPFQRRYPFGPVIERSGCRSVAAVAQKTGFPLRTVQRWAHLGVTDNYADRLAVRLGFHPSEIWPEWFPQEIAS
jgi:lambda repressor-like predicted transcriptional regulator